MGGSMSNDRISTTWKAIVEVHNESKALFLLCEELEPHEFRTFIQPYNELRHAYEHAVRCMANQLQLGERQFSEDYQLTNLTKALGHEYRGFFDCAGYRLAILLREAIYDILDPYSASCILAALPNYYSVDRPRIVEISEAIAQIRGDKDIARRPEITDEEAATADPDAIVAEVRKVQGCPLGTPGHVQAGH